MTIYQHPCYSLACHWRWNPMTEDRHYNSNPVWTSINLLEKLFLKQVSRSTQAVINKPSDIRTRTLEDQPRYVILFGYPRTGSSFTGELFNQNPDAFYLYEPLHDIHRYDLTE